MMRWDFNKNECKSKREIFEKRKECTSSLSDAALTAGFLIQFYSESNRGQVPTLSCFAWMILMVCWLSRCEGGDDHTQQASAMQVHVGLLGSTRQLSPRNQPTRSVREPKPRPLGRVLRGTKIRKCKEISINQPDDTCNILHWYHILNFIHFV